MAEERLSFCLHQLQEIMKLLLSIKEPKVPYKMDKLEMANLVIAKSMDNAQYILDIIENEYPSTYAKLIDTITWES